MPGSRLHPAHLAGEMKITWEVIYRQLSQATKTLSELCQKDVHLTVQEYLKIHPFIYYT